MGNGLAYFILIIWPFLAILFYKKYSVQKATILVLLGGFLFLPVKTAINIPMVPAFTKYSIATLSCLIGCVFIARKSIGFFNNNGVMKFLVLLLVISPFLTVMTNKESILIGQRYLPGLTNYDALSVFINELLFVLPFFIGRKFFGEYKSQLLLFKMVVVAGLVYSLIILVEARLSPQIHSWIYGYFPHDEFSQQKRFGGFRPVGFIGHGLEVAFFIASALICSVALMLNKVSIKPFNNKISSGYLLFILFLCKTVGAFVYAAFSVLVTAFLSPKKVQYIAIVLATIAFTYPILQIIELFPDKQLVNIAREFDDERAGSIEFRFDNEEILLEKAYEKILLGWGTWGRNRVYNQEGQDISVTDGTWIIQLGQFGFIGFIYYFGIMFLTVMIAKKAFIKTDSNNEKRLLAVHTLLVAIIMVDQLPNSSLVPWYWFLIGALAGRAENMIRQTSTKPVVLN